MLDADIRDFFASLIVLVRKFLGHRIAEKRVLRLIGKWLTAGVIEDGKWTERVRVHRRGHRFRRCSRTCTCTCATNAERGWNVGRPS